MQCLPTRAMAPLRVVIQPWASSRSAPYLPAPSTPPWALAPAAAPQTAKLTISGSVTLVSLAATGRPYDTCFVGGIATQPQVTNGATVCEVSVRLADGRLGIDCTHPSNPGSAPQGAPRGNSAAPVPRSAPPQPFARPQFQAINDKGEKLEATVSQQHKKVEERQESIAALKATVGCLT